MDIKRNQQVRETYGIQPRNAWMQRRRLEWDEQITRMGGEILVTILRASIPSRIGSPGR